MHGKKPYISSTATRNGVDNYVGNTRGVRIFSDCMTIANSGSVGVCFYQPFEFVASDHVTKLANEKFDRYVYLFMITVTRRLGEKYSFNREINDTRIQKERIMLPVDIRGNPDLQFMARYIQEHETKMISRYESHLEGMKAAGVMKLDDPQWRGFSIGKLFKLVQGKSKGLNHLRIRSQGVNYLGATNQNNGVLCQVQPVEGMVQKGNCIAFIRNGEGSMGYSVYKAEDFIATSDITLGYNEHINRYSGLFISSVSDGARGRYTFGYKRSKTRLAKEEILLPATAEGSPDFQYMESYVREVETRQLTKYIHYLQQQRSKGNR